MWDKLLDRMMTRLIRRGTLELTYPDGVMRRYGDGTDVPIRIQITDPALPKKCVLSPELAVGEGYVDGTLVIENDDLAGMLTLAISNRTDLEGGMNGPVLEGLRFAIGRIAQFNPVGRAKSNVSHHYDLSGELYDLFLDKDRQYSCAYFKSGSDTLEEAQAQKKQHIADKLLISPGMRILDIGCGWGGMALTLAKDYGAKVVGVTLSEEQYKVATERAEVAGLSDRIDIRLTDYRNVDETFDRVVSVGMFEHVGVPHYREYFRHVHNFLTKDGIALIHTIGRCAPPSYTSAWIRKYIFPGGYVPAMSEAMKAIEKERLWSTDVEVWRLHYAETLKHWYSRFMSNIDRARELYDDRFCRMWRFYLLASELSFRHDRQVVFQFQLTRRQEAVPLTRNYLYVESDERPERSKPRAVTHAAE